MFCLDFALSFACFGFATSEAKRRGYEPWDAPGGAYGLGALSGLFAATALYPFDLVRQIALDDKAPVAASAAIRTKPQFAASAVPFSALYFGLYFQGRGGDDAPAPIAQRVARAFGASGAALAVELPFDKAKLAIAGGARNAALFSLLRWPLSALLLVAFETATAARRTPPP